MTGALNWIAAGGLITLGLIVLGGGHFGWAAACAIGAVVNIVAAEAVQRRRR